jgi:SPP1 gp7 family putative phage head morphogenesis protein
VARSERVTVKGKFQPSVKAERDFMRALTKVGKMSGHIVDAYTKEGSVSVSAELIDALKNYADLITPWARRQSAKLLNQVQKQNKAAYANKSKVIGTLLNLKVAEAEVGKTARRLMEEQVELIRSIPIEAGQRAQKIAFEAAIHGQRAEPNQDTIAELQRQLGLSTEVATSRAQLIARTETARATASINQARAISVGSNQYRWHNSGDGAVRHSHKIYRGKPLQGRVFNWDEPPTLDDGMTGHPGTFPNCRCFAEPVFKNE